MDSTIGGNCQVLGVDNLGAIATTMGMNNLTPRAISVLVYLRGGCKSKVHIRNAISDVSTQTTLDLLGDLRDLRLVTRYNSESWGLTYEGQAWLENSGLRISDEAKQEMRTMYDKESVETRRLKPQRVVAG